MRAVVTKVEIATDFGREIGPGQGDAGREQHGPVYIMKDLQDADHENDRVLCSKLGSILSQLVKVDDLEADALITALAFLQFDYFCLLLEGLIFFSIGGNFDDTEKMTD